MSKSLDQTEPIIKELVTLIYQIEAQLKTIQKAFEVNQANGEKLKNKINKIQKSSKSIPSNLNDEMRTIMSLREWHWTYLERFNRFIDESKAIFLDFDHLKGSSALFVKGKLKKVLMDAKNFVFLGHTYMETLGDVFDGDYSKLISGEEIRQEAFKMMSQRLGRANKDYGFDL